MKKHFIYFLLLTMSISSLAQSALSRLKGQVLDSTNAPVIGATVLLKNENDSSQVYGSTTDISGNFQLNVVPGYYQMRISFVGFESLGKRLLVNHEEVNLGKVILHEQALALDEVAVVGKLIPVIVNGDTTEINAKAYQTNPDADASDLLEKMPTISIDNGNVQAEGENVKKVLVDGRPFFGNDPNAALRSLPAEVIDKIQVFDDLSDQAKLTGFDDGNSEKTINIVTKKEFRNGTFGKVTGGFGADDRYKLNGLLNSFNDDQRLTVIAQSNNINEQNFSTADLAGVTSGNSRRGGGGGRRGGGGGPGRPGGGNVSGDINDFLVGSQNGLVNTNAMGINYTDEFGEKVTFNASYFFNETENTAQTSLERQYFGEGQQYEESEWVSSKNQNHRFNMRLKYEINEHNTVIYTPSFTLQHYEGLSDLSTRTTQSASTLSSSLTSYESELLTYTLSNRLLLQHKFEKQGRTLSLHLSQSYAPSEASSHLYSETYYEAEQDSLDQQANLEQFDESYGARLMYTEPLGKKMMLMMNYTPSLSFGNSEKLTRNFNESNQSYSDLDPSLSNVFESRYITQEGGGGILYRMGSGGGFTPGGGRPRGNILMINANYQYAELETYQEYPAASETSKQFSALLPMIMWRAKPSTNSDLRVMMRTSTSVPSVSQLQGVLDNTNPAQLSIGNPLLNQQYQYNFFARYNLTQPDKSRTLFLMLGGSKTNNYIGTSTTTASNEVKTVDGVTLEPGVQLSKPVNLDGYYNLRALTTYGLPLSKIKSNLNLNLSAQYTRTPGLINEQLNFTYNPSLSWGAVLSSGISKHLDFTLSSSSTMNFTQSSLSEGLNTNYLSQQTKLKFYWNPWDGLVFRTNFNHQLYAGLSESFDDNYLIWSAGVAYKFMSNDRAELGLEAFDLLNQNQSISRTSTETYFEDYQTNTLQRYVMLSFKYNFGKYNVQG